MKKLYTVLFGVMMALCANAGIYMSGAFNGWSHCNPAQEFKETAATGVYTLSVDKLYGEFLICSGTPNTPVWSELRFGSNGQKVVEGQSYSAVKNGTGNFVMDGTVNNAVVTLDTNKSTLLVKGQAEANSFTVVYLVGDIDGAGWDETITEYPLEAKGNDTYEGILEIFRASYVKPRCGNQVLSAKDKDLVPEMGKTYTLGAGDKSVVLNAGKYTVTVVADQKAETCQITFNKEGGDVPTPVKDIYFYGDLNGANAWKAHALTNGSYTFTVTSGAFFSFSDGEPATDWSNVWRPENASKNVAITEDGTYKAGGINDFVWTITARGTYTVTPDATAKTFTITGFSADPTYPETVYIFGYINGYDFDDTDKAVAQTSVADGVYTWENVTIGDATAGTGEAAGYFNFGTVKGNTSKDWNTVNSGDRYGALTKDAPLAKGTPADVKLYAVNVSASATESWKVTPGDYNVVLNLKDMKVSLLKAISGIESIEAAEEAAPVYYNLQGVRVMNPENGMFIEVRGNKAVKVIK